MLVTIFCHIDDFYKEFEKELEKRLLRCPPGKKKRLRKKKLSPVEVMAIIVYFPYSGYKTFKTYYKKHVCVHLKDAFNELPSYNRFIELKQEVIFPLMLLAKLLTRDKCTGKSFVDSTALKVCHIRRSSSHKTFRGIARKGKTSVEWFFGLKVHLVINEYGEVINFDLTAGNVADNNHAVVEKLTEGVHGKLIGDKGYMSKELSKKLQRKNVKLITKVRKNMKPIGLSAYDQWLIGKRGLIESVIGVLKTQFSIEHSRHRSLKSFFAGVFSSLIAYAFYPNKPTIDEKFVIFA